MPKREDVRHKDYMDAFIKLKNKQNLVYSLRHIESYIWTLGNKIINALNNEGGNGVKHEQSISLGSSGLV